jgi:hypothetical protein
VKKFDSKTYAQKMISLQKDVLKMGLERAGQFRLPFSQYIARLIEKDYRTGERVITIVAKESTEYRKFRDELSQADRTK